MPLPDRPLRREPYDHEVRAATDFAALDVAYEDAAERLNRLFTEEWLPEQTEALAAQIRAATTQAELAAIRAPVVGVDDLADELATVAQRGAQEAADELSAQGISRDGLTDDALRALTADHAQAVAQQVADGLSLAASRRAVQLYGERTAEQIADEVTDYLGSLAHAWERDQLQGAVGQALNAGRLEVFAEVEAQVRPYASELLDAATCDDCAEIDGTEFDSIAEARLAYPSGGYVNCQGGPRCRGTVVVVGPED